MYDASININGFLASEQLRDGLGLINRSLASAAVTTSSGLPIKFRVAYDSNGQAGHVMAPSGVCGHSTPCGLSYSAHIDNLIENTEVIKLRRKYRADIVIFVRNADDNVSGLAGLATRPINATPLNASTASYATISQFGAAGVWAHEIGHLLGGDHSEYHVDQKGTAPRRAIVDVRVVDGELFCGQTTSAFYTIIADPVTCSARNRELFEQLTTKCGIKRCIGPIGISNRTNTGHDNINIAKPMAREMINYDLYYGAPEAEDPVAKIVQVSGNGKASVKHCWNAVGSTDPNGGVLAGFNWTITKSNALYHSGQTANVSSQFCWTPNISQTGTFDINLTVINAKGDKGQTKTSFNITYDPNDISAPVLGGTVDLLTIKLNWSLPQGAVSHYQVYEKDNLNPWQLANTSNDRVEYFFKTIRGGTFSYKVRGCTASNICGDFSNVKTFVLDSGGPSCGGKPC